MGSANLHKPLMFSREVHLSRYAIDLTPVTNLQFATFQGEWVQAKAYGKLPEAMEEGVPEGKNDHPVVYVDLDDVRAYDIGRETGADGRGVAICRPGTGSSPLSMGKEMKPGACNGGESGETTSVTAFLRGGRPSGVTTCAVTFGNGPKARGVTAGQSSDPEGREFLRSHGIGMVRRMRIMTFQFCFQVPSDGAWTQPLRDYRFPLRRRYRQNR